MAQLLPIASLIFTVGSTAFKIIGGINQAKAQEAQANQAAKIITLEAEEEKRKRVKRAKRLAGAQRAQFGVSGVTLGGSPTTVILEDLKEGFLDAETIFRRGQRQASQARFRGQIARARVPGIVAGGLGDIGGSLLTFSRRRSGTTRLS